MSRLLVRVRQEAQSVWLDVLPHREVQANAPHVDELCSDASHFDRSTKGLGLLSLHLPGDAGSFKGMGRVEQFPYSMVFCKPNALAYPLHRPFSIETDRIIAVMWIVSLSVRVCPS